MLTEKANAELDRRKAMWANLLAKGGPYNVEPSLLRALRLFGGAQGVWVDKVLTGPISPDGNGVTVSLLHTGHYYDDDLTDEGVIYHFPKTGRPFDRDRQEIAATKNAKVLDLPVFVVTRSRQEQKRRDVHVGWVEDWDDSTGVFLVTFSDFNNRSPSIAYEDDQPFQLVDKSTTKTETVIVRNRQQKFKFQVFKRYGCQCAVCSMMVPELLDAAHLRPKSEHGSDDPRNGLVLCAVHHRAFDAGLFGIKPDTLEIVTRTTGPCLDDLAISRRDLTHLANRPHPEAIMWVWMRWKKRKD